MKTQRMDNSVVPVTGASESRGKVVARQLTAAGVTVYVPVTGRQAGTGRGRRDRGRREALDVTGPASITDAARQVGAREDLVIDAASSDAASRDQRASRCSAVCVKTNKGGLRSMRLPWLDHSQSSCAISTKPSPGRATPSTAELVASVFSPATSTSISAVGETRLESIEVRAAGSACRSPRTARLPVIGDLGHEVDDLEDAKAELTRRGVVCRANSRPTRSARSSPRRRRRSG